MLKLFEQLFHRDDKTGERYPDDLVKRASERAVDATDPRVRILSSYTKKLRPAVEHAIDHVVGLVDALSAPISRCYCSA